MFFGCNKGKRKKVHYNNCIYGRRSEENNRVRYGSIDEAIESEAKLCKHCLSLDRRIKAEQDKIKKLARDFNLKCCIRDGLPYIKDGMGKWKLVPSKDGKSILLFHQNIKQCEDEQENGYFLEYHRHQEEVATVSEALEYIADHFHKYLTTSNISMGLYQRAKSIHYKDSKHHKKRANKAKDSHSKYLKRCEKREAVGNVFKIMEMLKHDDNHRSAGAAYV